MRGRPTTRRVNFDPIARAYRWLEYATFGPLLARCRFAQLDVTTTARRALVFGDGDGRFLDRMLAANPTLTADAVDSSGAMLRLLNARLPAAAQPRLTLHHCDALSFAPAGHYDLVVTHFFLDCLAPAQMDQLLALVSPHLAPGAHWLVSEFAVPAGALRSRAARALIRLMYVCFGVVTGLPVRALPDYAAALRRYGFSLIRQRTFAGGMLLSQLWSIV